VAKARRPSPAQKRSAPKARGSKPAKKAAARAPRKKAVKKKAKAAAKPVQKVVELKKIREQFGAVLGVLSSRRSADPDATAKLDSARSRVSQMMTALDDICDGEMQEICGPDMVFPVP
jgi:hypothetical protein